MATREPSTAVRSRSALCLFLCKRHRGNIYNLNCDRRQAPSPMLFAVFFLSRLFIALVKDAR